METSEKPVSGVRGVMKDTGIRKLSTDSSFYKDGLRWVFILDGALHYTKSRNAARELQRRLKYNIKTFLTRGPFGEIIRKTTKELRKDGVKVDKKRFFQPSRIRPKAKLQESS